MVCKNDEERLEHMKKKLYVALSVCLLNIMICGGCGKEKQTNKADVATSEQTEDAGPITLRVWAGEEDHEILSKLADSFIAENS